MAPPAAKASIDVPRATVFGSLAAAAPALRANHGRPSPSLGSSASSAFSETKAATSGEQRAADVMGHQQSRRQVGEHPREAEGARDGTELPVRQRCAPPDLGEQRRERADRERLQSARQTEHHQQPIGPHRRRDQDASGARARAGPGGAIRTSASSASSAAEGPCRNDSGSKAIAGSHAVSDSLRAPSRAVAAFGPPPTNQKRRRPARRAPSSSQDS